MNVIEALPQLVHDLGEACGFDLTLVEESVFAEGVFIAATARSPRRSRAARLVTMEALAKIMITQNDADEWETWALIFFFVIGDRVAPRNASYLTLKLDQSAAVSRWVAVGWEEDVYEEWTGLVRLDDE